MADRSSPDTLLIRDIVQAAIELACIRHDLCFYDEPPLVVEQCAEIVTDVFNALRGIDTCDPEPCPEFSAILAALEDRQEAAPERRPPFCNYAIVPVASGGFLHCNDSSGHGGEHSWRGPWTVYENYGGVPSEATPSKENAPEVLPVPLCEICGDSEYWHFRTLLGNHADGHAFKPAAPAPEVQRTPTSISAESASPLQLAAESTAPVGTPQKETPQISEEVAAWRALYPSAEFVPVPEGVQGKEPQTRDEQKTWEDACDCCRIDGPPVFTDCAKWIHCYDDGNYEPCVAGRVFSSGEAAGRRSAITEMKQSAQSLIAARTAWLEQHGVPISREFANFAEAIGDLTDLIAECAELEEKTRP